MALFQSKVMIFDLDGTLIDSRIDLANSVNYVLKDAGLKELPEDKIFSYIGNGSKSLIEKSLGRSGKDKFTQVYNTFQSYYSDHLLDNTTLYEDVEETLSYFSDKSLYILSNKHQEFCQKILDGFNLSSAFKGIYGGDSFDKMKPEPLGVKKIRKEEGVLQEECILIGDSPQDINAGKNAGIKMAAVTYGYHSENRLMKDNPDLLIDSLSALRNYID